MEEERREKKELKYEYEYEYINIHSNCSFKGSPGKEGRKGKKVLVCLDVIFSSGLGSLFGVYKRERELCWCLGGCGHALSLVMYESLLLMTQIATLLLAIHVVSLYPRRACFY